MTETNKLKKFVEDTSKMFREEDEDYEKTLRKDFSKVTNQSETLAEKVIDAQDDRKLPITLNGYGMIDEDSVDRSFKKRKKKGFRKNYNHEIRGKCITKMEKLEGNYSNYKDLKKKQRQIKQVLDIAEEIN